MNLLKWPKNDEDLFADITTMFIHSLCKSVIFLWHTIGSTNLSVLKPSTKVIVISTLIEMKWKCRQRFTFCHSYVICT